jgi:NAD(P)H-flavin reductase
VLSILRPLSDEGVEVGIRISSMLPHHAGQYAQVRFDGYPTRSYSLTHPLRSEASGTTIFFHVRRMERGRVSSALGAHILPGHRVSLTGPYGDAHFRQNLGSRLVLIGTNTGFAPIWAIAVAALRENPSRRMMIIVGGRTLESLYMGSALTRLARFPNVLIVPVCSGPEILPCEVLPGRPTDYMPRLLPTDVLYACGAPGMVDAVKSVAATFGAVCYADPFVPSVDERSKGVSRSRISGERKLPLGRRAHLAGFDTHLVSIESDHGIQPI